MPGAHSVSSALELNRELGGCREPWRRRECRSVRAHGGPRLDAWTTLLVLSAQWTLPWLESACRLGAMVISGLLALATRLTGARDRRDWAINE